MRTRRTSKNRWGFRTATAVRTTLAFVAMAVLLPIGVAQGAERQYLVILANSPKQFAASGGQPPGGLANAEAVRRQYFDKINPNIDSMAEYWEEISYGDVTIIGDVTQWLSLPWPFSSQGETTPADFIDFNQNGTFEYGAGERLTNLQSVIIDTDGNPNNIDNGPFSLAPGAGHRTQAGRPVWKPGERFVDMDGDGKWDGLDEATNLMDWDGDGVADLRGPWTDLNGNRMAEAPQGCVYLPDADNDGNPDCCPDGPNDPTVTPPITSCPRRGLDIMEGQNGFENTCPPTTWETPNGTFNDCNGNLIPDACDIDPDSADCQALGWNGPFPGNASPDNLEGSADGIPDECQAGEEDVEPSPRCEFDDSDMNRRLAIVEPFENFMRRWDPCFTDSEAAPANRLTDRVHWVKVYDPNSPFAGIDRTCSNTDATYDVGDPSYILNNYPANTIGKQALIAEAHGRVIVGEHDPLGKASVALCRCENGCQCANWGCQLNAFGLLDQIDDPYIQMLQNVGPTRCIIGQHVDYSPPDDWENINDADAPEGQGFTSKFRVLPGLPQSNEVGVIEDLSTPQPSWLQQAWKDRYRVPEQSCDPGASMPSPTQPCSAPSWNSQILEVEVFADANPDNFGGVEDRRYFNANAGGLNGNGSGWIGCSDQYDQVVRFETGNDGFTIESFQELCNAPILPDEVNGENTPGQYYDGFIEYDDLPSSKYHRAGDQFLGEVTSPFNEQNFGHDLGNHSAGSNPTSRDNVIPPAGPYAINVHGNGGFDAGNLLNLELLTWRQKPPFNDGVAWESEMDAPGIGTARLYHPYAGPTSGLNNGYGLGFRDYNLDGLIDQGESRYAGSENYIVDSVTSTVNDGTGTHYPFNRRRILEDCVAILDQTIDFDDWIDEAALSAVTCGGSMFADIPDHYRGGGVPNSVMAKGLQSGIVLLPQGTPDEFPIAPSFYPIHNEDADTEVGPNGHTFPATGQQRIHWNLFFHDLVKSLSGESESMGDDLGTFHISYSAHEYLHSWEGFPDLYDYDVFEESSNLVINQPIGRWDIMANGGLVHPTPILKEKPCTEWINPVNLRSILTPGVDTVLTLPQYELVRDGNAYFLENQSRPGERYYLYSVGEGFDDVNAPNGGMPGEGMLILHTDVGANPDGLPFGQRQGPPWDYLIVQADGLGQLDAGDNRGDAGDPWPGSTGNTRFNFNTVPAATWYTTTAWSGLDILDVVPDNNGSVQVTLNWVPTDIPSLRFINPPGGTSVAGKYQINFDATDVFGGTTIRLYHTKDPDDISISSQRFIGELKKTTPGTRRLSISWNVSGLTDGMYHVFAKLVPGPGADGTEKRFNNPVPGRNNEGNGTMSVTNVGIETNKSRVETWTVRLIDIRPNGTLDWLVNSSLTQPPPDDMDVNQDPYPHLLIPGGQNTGTYTSIGNEVTFQITRGSVPFVIGDVFTFTTTGITAPSSLVTVAGGEISDSPRARIFATPLSGRPPLRVTFDARDSVDPFGQPLRFEWDFGDGSTGTGSTLQHTFEQAGTITVTLRAINQISGLFGEAKVDINVTNNSPRAVINASPTSGPAPLEVTFNGNQSSDTETPANQLIYQWDFGDGSTGNPTGTPGVQIDTTHFYTRRADGSLCTASNPCEFTAKLTVTDAGGKSSTDTVVIRAGNTDPVIVISTSMLRGPAPLEVTFDASDTVDPDGQDLDITWRWGDGSAEQTFPIEGPNGDGKFKHTFNLRQGETISSYLVTAVVTDSAGASRQWPGVRVTVGVDDGGVEDNERPTASIAASTTSGVAGQTEFVFDGRNSTDPEGDTLTYQWDFGGGVRRSGSTVAYIFDEPGTYTVTLFVTDTSNLTDDATIQITVTQGDGNRDPLAFIGSGPRSGIAPITLTFNGQNSFDPDGDPLSYRWEFVRDNNLVGIGSGPIVSQTFEQAGQYEVILAVSDGRGGVGIAGPEMVRVTARVDDPDSGRPPPDNGNNNGGGIPPSEDQRPPAICGMGMIMSFMLMMLGLTALRLTRRR